MGIAIQSISQANGLTGAAELEDAVVELQGLLHLVLL